MQPSHSRRRRISLPSLETRVSMTLSSWAAQNGQRIESVGERDALLVPPAEVRRRPERLQCFLGHARSDHARAQRDHVRVVVLARELRGVAVVDECAAHAVDLVRRDRDADPRAAHHQPERAGLRDDALPEAAAPKVG